MMIDVCIVALHGERRKSYNSAQYACMHVIRFELLPRMSNSRLAGRPSIYYIYTVIATSIARVYN